MMESHYDALSSLYRRHCEGISLSRLPIAVRKGNKMEGRGGGDGHHHQLNIAQLRAPSASDFKTHKTNTLTTRRLTLFASSDKNRNNTNTVTAYANSSSLSSASSLTHSWRGHEKVNTADRFSPLRVVEGVGALELLEALRAKDATWICLCQRVQPWEWSTHHHHADHRKNEEANGERETRGAVIASPAFSSSSSRRFLPLKKEEDALEERMGPWAHLWAYSKRHQDDEVLTTPPLGHELNAGGDGDDLITNKQREKGEKGEAAATAPWEEASCSAKMEKTLSSPEWVLSRVVRWKYAQNDPRAHLSDALPHAKRRLPLLLFIDASKVELGTPSRGPPPTPRDAPRHTSSPSLVSARFAENLEEMGFLALPGGAQTQYHADAAGHERRRTGLLVELLGALHSCWGVHASWRRFLKSDEESETRRRKRKQG